jgi:nuclear pore complex protein Nup62
VPAATPGFNFGASASTTPTPAPTFGAKPAATPAAASGFNFGAAAAPQASTSATPAPAFGAKPTTTPTPAPTFGTAPAATTPALSLGTKPAVAPLTSTTPANTMAEINRLKGKNLDEIINTWTSELEQHRREFHAQAVKMSERDQQLIENGAHITQLYREMERLESHQHDVNRQLEYIEVQQRDMENALNQYEGDLETLLNERVKSNTAHLGYSDMERKKMYEKGADVAQQLEEMNRVLSGMIDQANAVLAHGESADPISQMVQILNAHLTSLEWIDTTCQDLNTRLTTLQSTSSHTRDRIEQAAQGNLY